MASVFTVIIESKQKLNIYRLKYSLHCNVQYIKRIQYNFNTV
jgi:hypothetical protein